MTYKEALKYAETIHVDLTSIESAATCSDFINTVIDALSKADKNRWHDLRKNPEDLPQGEETVIVCLHSIYNNIGYNRASLITEFIPGEKFFKERELNNTVIAWKQLETFEED